MVMGLRTLISFCDFHNNLKWWKKRKMLKITWNGFPLCFFFGSWVLISLKHVAVKSVDFCCGSLTIEKNQYPSGRLSNWNYGLVQFDLIRTGSLLIDHERVTVHMNCWRRHIIKQFKLFTNWLFNMVSEFRFFLNLVWSYLLFVPPTTLLFLGLGQQESENDCLISISGPFYNNLSFWGK